MVGIILASTYEIVNKKQIAEVVFNFEFMYELSNNSFKNL